MQRAKVRSSCLSHTSPLRIWLRFLCQRPHRRWARLFAPVREALPVSCPVVCSRRTGQLQAGRTVIVGAVWTARRLETGLDGNSSLTKKIHLANLPSPPHFHRHRHYFFWIILFWSERAPLTTMRVSTLLCAVVGLVLKARADDDDCWDLCFDSEPGKLSSASEPRLETQLQLTCD